MATIVHRGRLASRRIAIAIVHRRLRRGSSSSRAGLGRYVSTPLQGTRLCQKQPVAAGHEVHENGNLHMGCVSSGPAGHLLTYL